MRLLIEQGLGALLPLLGFGGTESFRGFVVAQGALPANQRRRALFELLLARGIRLRCRFAGFTRGVEDALVALAFLFKIGLGLLFARAAAALEDFGGALAIELH